MSKVCRDFCRNVCFRGSKCKYSHQTDENSYQNYAYGEESDFTSSPNIQKFLMFCNDFQFTGNCQRTRCNFLHCSKAEKDQYISTGYLPPLIKDQAIVKGMAPDFPTIYGDKPICKDYLKGDCSRKSCKYRHVSAMQYDIELTSRLNNSSTKEDSNRKRKCEMNSDLSYSKTKKSECQDFIYMKQQIEDLKQRVSDLCTANEYLLGQNAQLRIKLNMTPDSTSAANVTAPPTLQGPPPQPTQGQPIAIAPVASITCMDACSSVSIGSVPGSTVRIGVPTQPQGVPASLAQGPAIVTPSPAVGGPSINIQPPSVSLAPNTAIVQETRFLSYPITSIIPPM